MMRLELALVVGILLFCSWCAYIVARMGSSVNVASQPPSQQTTALDGSGGSFGGGASEPDPPEQLRQLINQTGGSSAAATGQPAILIDHTLMAPPTEAQRQQPAEQQQQFHQQPEPTAQHQQQQQQQHLARHYDASETVPARQLHYRQFPSYSAQLQPSQVPPQGQANQYYSQQQQQQQPMGAHVAQPSARVVSRPQWQAYALPTSLTAPVAPPTRAVYEPQELAASSEGEAAEDENEEEDEEAGPSSNGNANEMTTTDEEPQSGSGSGDHEGQQMAAASEEDPLDQHRHQRPYAGGRSQQSSDYYDEDTGPGGGSSPMEYEEEEGAGRPQSELEEISNRRSFNELESDSSERDKDGHLIVTRKRHLINGKPVLASDARPASKRAKRLRRAGRHHNHNRSRGRHHRQTAGRQAQQHRPYSKHVRANNGAGGGQHNQTNTNIGSHNESGQLQLATAASGDDERGDGQTLKGYDEQPGSSEAQGRLRDADEEEEADDDGYGDAEEEDSASGEMAYDDEGDQRQESLPKSGPPAPSASERDFEQMVNEIDQEDKLRRTVAAVAASAATTSSTGAHGKPATVPPAVASEPSGSVSDTDNQLMLGGNISAVQYQQKQQRHKQQQLEIPASRSNETGRMTLLDRREDAHDDDEGSEADSRALSAASQTGVNHLAWAEHSQPARSLQATPAKVDSGSGRLAKPAENISKNNSMSSSGGRKNRKKRRRPSVLSSSSSSSSSAASAPSGGAEAAASRDSHEHRVQETLTAQQWDDDSTSGGAGDDDGGGRGGGLASSKGVEELETEEDQDKVDNIVERDEEARQLERLARDILQDSTRVPEELERHKRQITPTAGVGQQELELGLPTLDERQTDNGGRRGRRWAGSRQQQPVVGYRGAAADSQAAPIQRDHDIANSTRHDDGEDAGARAVSGTASGTGNGHHNEHRQRQNQSHQYGPEPSYAVSSGAMPLPDPLRPRDELTGGVGGVRSAGVTGIHPVVHRRHQSGTTAALAGTMAKPPVRPGLSERRDASRLTIDRADRAQPLQVPVVVVGGGDEQILATTVSGNDGPTTPAAAATTAEAVANWKVMMDLSEKHATEAPTGSANDDLKRASPLSSAEGFALNETTKARPSVVVTANRNLMIAPSRQSSHDEALQNGTTMTTTTTTQPVDAPVSGWAPVREASSVPQAPAYDRPSLDEASFSSAVVSSGSRLDLDSAEDGSSTGNLKDVVSGSEDMHVAVLASPPPATGANSNQPARGPQPNSLAPSLSSSSSVMPPPTIPMSVPMPVPMSTPVPLPAPVYTASGASLAPSSGSLSGHWPEGVGGTHLASGSHTRPAKRKKKRLTKKLAKKKRSKLLDSKYKSAEAYASKQKRRMKKGNMKKKKRKSEKEMVSSRAQFEGLTKGKKLGHGHKANGAKKGSAYLKDKGYKKRGFKKSYHKLETGDHKTYFDEFRDKDHNKKWKNFDDKHKYSQNKKWAGYDSKHMNQHKLKHSKGNASKLGHWREKSHLKHSKAANKYKKSKKYGAMEGSVSLEKSKSKKKKDSGHHHH